MFDDDNHERREDVSQRTWRNEDSSAFPRSFSQAKHPTNQDLVEVLVGRESSFPFVLLRHLVATIQIANPVSCDALRAVASQPYVHGLTLQVFFEPLPISP